MPGTLAASRAVPRRRLSLAWRLVALGVLQLGLLAVTAVVIFVAQGPRGAAHPREVIDPTVQARLEALIDQPRALAAALEELEQQRVEVTLYDSQRQLIASNIDPPLAIPPRRFRWRTPPPGEPAAGSAAAATHPAVVAGDRAGSADRPVDRSPELTRDATRRAMVIPLRVHGERGYLVARGVHSRPSFITGPLLTLVCGFVIVLISALLTARWIVRPIDRLSRTARALGAGDLAARSRLARSDEIGELGHRIDEMADRIQTLLVTEKELLANVAHELRTPLTRIGVALDLAAEGDADAARASLAEIAVDVSELETIVDDILTAMRFEVATGAQLPLRKAVVAPSEIATAAAGRQRSRHPSRPLEVTVAGELPTIEVDPMLFRRVIDNLLENGHKYSPDPDAGLALAVSSEAGRVVFEVRDRGIGILAEDLPRVFTAFFRGDRSRSRETGGVGLGLTLAKRIVEAHGGTIEVTSEPGAGTTVRVTAPAAT